MGKYPVKQVILIRRDLKMRRGKEIAQGAHASIAFLTHALSESKKVKLTQEAWDWIDGSFAKICLQVPDEETLVKTYQAALDAGLTAHLITDSGTTEFGGVPTRTTCAIGPNRAEDIDKITGHLKLY